MSKKVLLADDASTFVKLEQTYLESKGYQVVMAGNGKEALEKLASQKPDLVVLDLIMPEMEGDQVCRLIKASPQYKDIPVIMITTKGDKKGEERCRKAGCNMFLTKPLRKSVFLDAVKQLLPD
ncbi:MAG: response regulator [Nitrospirae bacterium]|nr:response regulator [Nitrospirota bacterium]